MKGWIEPDYEDNYWDVTEPTSHYQHGQLTIYSGPKRPKVKPPAYGFKFVETEVKKRKRPTPRPRY